MLGDRRGADVRLGGTPDRPLPGAVDRARIGTASLAVALGAVVVGLKYSAVQLTGSIAILGDTLASIVTLLGGLFALSTTITGAWPVPRGDADGAARAETLRALLKGGMLALAGVLVIKEAGEALLFGHVVRQVDYGILITVGTGLASAALGSYLLHAGRRSAWPSLLADGTAALADVWTSVATAVALGLVRATGFEWLDPTMAIMIGASLLWNGLHLARRAANELLGHDDAELLERLLHAMNAHLVPGVIRVHALRAVPVGRRVSIEAQIVVPEFWTVEEAHDFCAAFKHRVAGTLGGAADVQWYIVPCRRQHCARCEVHPCPIRVQPFSGRGWITLDEARQAGPLGQ